jgi:hypothetical protein
MACAAESVLIGKRAYVVVEKEEGEAKRPPPSLPPDDTRRPLPLSCHFGIARASTEPTGPRFALVGRRRILRLWFPARQEEG